MNENQKRKKQPFYIIMRDFFFAYHAFKHKYVEVRYGCNSEDINLPTVRVLQPLTETFYAYLSVRKQYSWHDKIENNEFTCWSVRANVCVRALRRRRNIHEWNMLLATGYELILKWFPISILFAFLLSVLFLLHFE